METARNQLSFIELNRKPYICYYQSKRKHGYTEEQLPPDKPPVAALLTNWVHHDMTDK